MNQGEILVVPIQVQALCVGSPDSSGPNFALRSLADFTTLPYVDGGVQHNRKPYISADVVSRGGPFEGQITLPTGIHLHWALPAGLTHGQQQPDGSIVYPNVPNRWLVTRLVQRNATSSNPSIDKKSWVVESDRLNLHVVSPNGMHQPTVPTDPSLPGQNFRFIGQAFEVNAWAEDPQAEHFPNLTAVGYGEATFASYYPNCSSVFGFYDNPSSNEYDYNHDTIAYQVSGWYSDPSKDPAANGLTSGDNPYGWTFAGGSVTNTTCSGLVENIVFNTYAHYISNTNTDLTVAIGPSSQEALSALMANQEGVDAETTELVLNALQFGLLTQLGTINGTIQNFEELVHEAGFSNKNAGTVWQVRKRTQAGSDDNFEGEVTLPEPIAQDLNALNVQQSELDELKETLASKRWQLFSDWYKYLVVEYETKYTPASVRDQAQSMREYLLLQVNEINNLQSRVEEQGELQTSIDTLANFISGLLDDQYELTNDVAAPRYWQANNPFLVLQGDDIAPVNRTGSDETLACRNSQHLVSVTEVEGDVIQAGQSTFEISFIVMEIPLAQGAPQQLLNLMLNDAVLMSYSLQPGIAALLCSEYYKENYGAILNFTSALSVLQTGLTQFIANENHPQTNYYYYTKELALAPDSLMIFTWSNTPWLPMLVEYEVEFKPVQYIQAGDAYAPDFISSNFSFDDDDIELTYTKPLPTVSQLYKGTMLLSAAAQVDLSESIRQFMLQTESTDGDLQTVLDNVSSMPILAQELSGLNQSMLMRQEILQMKVADPLANTFDQPFVAAIRDAVAEESVYSPEFNASFNPIRTGTLRIHALRLVDTFGRFKDFNSVESVHVAKGILPPPSLHASAGTAFLPPRITQPARLLFRWLSADNDAIESNSHPATSPIIGWVLPDYPDNSLFIYNADGTPLGELAVSANSSNVLWFAAPGGAFPMGTDFQTVMENQLPWLRNFATGIYNNGNPALLGSLINSLRTTAEQTMPAGSSNNTAGLLIGQPLAITRATLQLDLAGDPAANESWDSFAQSLVANDNIDSAGFTEVKFPVQLGQSANMNDGLFAYWIQENTAIDFTQLHTPQSTAQGLSLTTGYTRGSIKTVLMLVDPKGEVHANTGILPVKSIAIPSDQYDAALNSLSVTFLTAPVLSGSNTNNFSIPLPKIDAGQWSWVSVSAGEWQSQNFQDDVQNANQGALDYTPQQLLEGWLRLRDFEN